MLCYVMIQSLFRERVSLRNIIGQASVIAIIQKVAGFALFSAS